MTYALHFGIDVSHLVQLRREFDRGPGLAHYIDGDGWNCWGEAVGDDVNDASTLHVVVPLARKRHARLTLGALASVGIPFVTMGGYDKQTGILAVLTDMDDSGCLDGREGDEHTRSWYRICPDPDCGRDHHAGRCS